jgi:nicotine blue oxidoreductase
MHAGLVLAAGASSRMGRPKALLPMPEEPAVGRVCTALTDGGCDRVVVVLGAHGDAVERAVPSGAEVVRHDGWAAGRTSSVKAGLTILQRADAVLIAPVDRPLFEAEDVRRLLAADAPVAVPVYEGTRGHPLRVARALFGQILALGDDEPLHSVLHAHEDHVKEVPTDNAGVLTNIDTPQDYEKALALARRRSPA